MNLCTTASLEFSLLGSLLHGHSPWAAARAEHGEGSSLVRGSRPLPSPELSRSAQRSQAATGLSFLRQTKEHEAKEGSPFKCFHFSRSFVELLSIRKLNPYKKHL